MSVTHDDPRSYGYDGPLRLASELVPGDRFVRLNPTAYGDTRTVLRIERDTSYTRIFLDFARYLCQPADARVMLLGVCWRRNGTHPYTTHGRACEDERDVEAIQERLWV